MSRIDAYRMVRRRTAGMTPWASSGWRSNGAPFPSSEWPLGRGELGDRCHDPPPGRRSVIIASERWQCLRGILPARSSVTSEALSVQAKGGALFTLMRARDLEGIVAKRLNDPYKAQVTWFKLMRWDRRGYPPAFNEPEADAKLSHHPTFRDPDDEPEEPDMPETGETKPAEAHVNDLESRLFKGRKVMVFGQITDKLARDVVARILALVDESAKPIQIYVNSPGGHVESGDSIHDIIKFVRSSAPIYMIGTGWVASAGALIYAAGEKRFRFCLPNTRFLLHQPMGGVQGPATDIDIEAREIIKMRERLSQIIATETGQSIERVRNDTDRNYWMSASEAIDYGLAYKIVRSIEDLK